MNPLTATVVRSVSPPGRFATIRWRLAAATALLVAGAASVACDRSPTGGSPDEASVELPAEALQAMQRALDRYETVRSMLAEDASGDLGTAAADLTSELAAAREVWPQGGESNLAELATEIESATSAAAMLATGGDLLDTRRVFGEVTRHLLPAAAADVRLRQGRRVFQCPMTETFALWMQSDEEADNPYLGAAMPTCGERIPWSEAADEAGGTS